MNKDGDDDLTPPDGRKKHKVGYGKPPQGSRFKKGQSGNPKGRPKGSKNKASAHSVERYKEIFRKEAYRTIKVNEGGKTVSMAMADAVARSIATNAAKGRPGAQKIFSGTLAAIEREEKVEREEVFQKMLEYTSKWKEEISRCKSIGIKVPDPIPHPDHIKFDLHTLEVWAEGPNNKEEKMMHDRIINNKKMYEEALPLLQKELKEDHAEEFMDEIQADIDQATTALEYINKFKR